MQNWLGCFCAGPKLLLGMQLRALVRLRARYWLKPLLRDGKKADIRVYGVIASFQPLRVYLHAAGAARVLGEAQMVLQRALGGNWPF